MSIRTRILVSIFIMLWVQTLLSVGIVHVNGDSMNKTLQDGDYYLYNNKKFTDINRFDIVVADSNQLEETIIKRVVGLPGETVIMKDGELYVNNTHLEQNFDYIPINDTFSYTLADDEYFLLGDNRPISIDSRYIGPLKDEEIKEVVIV